ncbi:MAG: tryptophan synthase subunit alpha [Myxococcales bacterium]|jgi:tryptophan synthase alpha chain
MGRLREAFDRAAAEERAALVVYLCAGDPDLETTVRLMRAIAEAGADVIEVGMPFSDPTADGPVIQRASERALSAGTTMKGVLGAVRALRADASVSPDVGVVLFGYYNPIIAFGEERLAREAAEAGVDGLLVVDLPPEESAPLVGTLRSAGLDFVPLVAPTTPDERMDRIAESADGFLYYVSLTGVTGARADLDAAGARARVLHERTGKPVAVGFGVKTPDDARKLAARAQGVVVGSAICLEIEGSQEPDEAVRRVGELTAALRDACG